MIEQNNWYKLFYGNQKKKETALRGFNNPRQLFNDNFSKLHSWVFTHITKV